MTRASFLLYLFLEELHLFSEKLQNVICIPCQVTFTNQVHIFKKVVNTLCKMVFTLKVFSQTKKST